MRANMRVNAVAIVIYYQIHLCYDNFEKIPPNAQPIDYEALIITDNLLVVHFGGVFTKLSW